MVYVAFEGDICCWHKNGYSKVNRLHCNVYFTYMLSNVGLYIDYSSSVMKNICRMWLAYLFRGICW